MGPLAEIIIDDAVADMGATRETFPREMVSALAERIAGEIRDTDKRVRFQQNMLSLLRSQPASVERRVTGGLVASETCSCRRRRQEIVEDAAGVRRDGDGGQLVRGEVLERLPFVDLDRPFGRCPHPRSRCGRGR